MGMKQFAIGVTTKALNKAAKEFGDAPAAINWAKVSMTMKAHQFANFEPEVRLEATLKNVPSDLVVRALANAFDTDIIHLENDIMAGVARLYKVA